MDSGTSRQLYERKTTTYPDASETMGGTGSLL